MGPNRRGLYTWVDGVAVLECVHGLSANQPMPKDERGVHRMGDSTAIRAATYRLHACTPGKARKLHQLAGACRYVWNHFLAENRRRYPVWRAWRGQVAGTPLADKMPPPPSVTFFSLGKRFTALRRETPWLQDLPFAIVRYTLKRQADAWQRAFKHGGFPNFRGRHGEQGFTIPDAMNIRLGAVTGIRRLWVPKVGWCVLSRSGGCLYAGTEAKQAVVKLVGGKWYATVFYEVPETAAADNGIVVGIDRNVGQMALSTGEIIHLPDTVRLEARRRRYQRMMARRVKGSGRRSLARHRCAKTGRKLAMVRRNWAHQTSRKLADACGTVVM